MTGLTIEIALIVMAIVCGIGIAVIFAAVYNEINKDSAQVRSRVRRVRGSSVEYGAKNSKSKKSGFKSAYSDKGSLGKLYSWLENRLILAEIKMKPEEFLILWVCLMFIPSLLIGLLMKNVLPMLALFIIGAAGPQLYLNSKMKKRLQLFDNQLSDALVICCNCISSGMSFQQAMETIAHDMPAPIGTEFARVLNEMRYGATLEKALTDMVDRMGSSDLMLVVSSVLIQRGTGGNLSEILNTISETIKDRLTIKREIKTITSQGRMSSLIIGCLPIALGLLIMLINPSYMSFFFSSATGIGLLCLALGLEALGFWVINKIITVKY